MDLDGAAEDERNGKMKWLEQEPVGVGGEQLMRTLCREGKERRLNHVLIAYVAVILVNFIYLYILYLFLELVKYAGSARADIVASLYLCIYLLYLF